MKSFLTASLVLATCAAFAAIPTQTFTGDTKDEKIWFGAGTVSGGVLVVEGTEICSNATGAVESEFVKTSFKVKAPEEGMATADLPTGDEVAGCQIAVATGPATGDNLKVMVFSKTNATEAGWAETGLTVPTNKWFDVALSFNYESQTASIQISSQEIGSQVAGPFTNVTVSATTAKINSLNFVGSASLDDVLIDEALPKSELASTLAGLQIYTNSLPADVAAAVATANLKTDNNYTKHIEAGLTPSEDALVFNATALSTVTEDNTVKTVITVPCDADYGQVYKVVITGANGEIDGSPVTAKAGAISENSRALKFVMPTTEEKVLKIRVESGAPAAN